MVSLTLTPMMCAQAAAAQAGREQGWFYRVIGARASRCVIRILRQDAARGAAASDRSTLLVAVATLVATVYLYMIVPKGFFPVQDTGVILGISEAPQNISFTAMAKRQQELATR